MRRGGFNRSTTAVLKTKEEEMALQERTTTGAMHSSKTNLEVDAVLKAILTLKQHGILEFKRTQQGQIFKGACCFTIAGADGDEPNLHCNELRTGDWMTAPVDRTTGYGLDIDRAILRELTEL